MIRPALLAAVLAGCAPVADAPGDTDDDALPACAWAEGSHAAVLAEADWRPEGPDALAAPGDLILANPHAAFVIQAPDAPRTYYHYGGTPIDAVALAGCDQVGNERWGELGFLPSRLELTDFVSSTMRQFQGVTATVVSDGSDGGPAHVRVEGTDGPFWLVDYELTKRAATNDGPGRPLSEPLGLALTVDYRLWPDRPVLEIEVSARNLDATPKNPAMGAAVVRPAETPPLVYAEGALSFGGFNLQLGVPWFAASGGDAAYAVAFDSDNGAWAEVSGFNALFDANHLLSGTFGVAPAGEPGDTATMRMWFAVGAGDEASATGPLLDVLPGLGGRPITPQPVSGRVVDEVGAAVSDAEVLVERQRADGTWRAYDRLRVGDDGVFAGTVARVDGPVRLTVRGDAVAPVDPLPLDTTAGDLRVVVPTRGTLTVRATDGDRAIPVRATLFQGDARRRVLLVPPGGETFTVPAGPWGLAVTRGTTHEPVWLDVNVAAGVDTPVDVELPEVVDTTGWVSFDGHVHAGPSPDSDVPIPDRFATAAAEGLDVVVHTEHEVIQDNVPVLDASPWAPFVHSLAGQEVTATVPEHLGMWGVPMEGAGVRGDPIPWYRLDLGQIYGLMRERGATVVTLNHPKYGCNWLCQIGWDAVEARPTLADPTRLGLDADADLWSWDFDAVELQNGFGDPFVPHPTPESSSLFEDWQNWIHHGHRVTAVGTSDVHGLDTPGTPRTYVPAPSDDPRAFTREQLGEAIRAGRAVVSTGAFVTAAIDGAGVGDTVTVDAGPVRLDLRVQAPAAIDVDRVVVHVNCDRVLMVPADDRDGVVKLDATVTLDVEEDAQVVVLAYGEAPYPRGLETPPSTLPRGFTNPIYVDRDGNGRWDPPGGKTCVGGARR